MREGYSVLETGQVNKIYDNMEITLKRKMFYLILIFFLGVPVQSLCTEPLTVHA